MLEGASGDGRRFGYILGPGSRATAGLRMYARVRCRSGDGLRPAD
uniref:Uncharacterized protein n=1 Tax=Verrucosispora sp. MS100047 TaxID=1410949 RepID=A0A097CT40_9ACTN|nr:hypothetical protein VASRM7_560 [Verrucosispora sp. MS100047]